MVANGKSGRNEVVKYRSCTQALTFEVLLVQRYSGIPFSLARHSAVMDSIKVLAMVEEAKVHDLKRRELIKYVLKLRKFVVKQNEKIIYQKSKISHLVRFGLY